ncbi:hypothetical protein Tco_0351872, partial [Tanacetum coccineum]
CRRNLCSAESLIAGIFARRKYWLARIFGHSLAGIYVEPAALPESSMIKEMPLLHICCLEDAMNRMRGDELQLGKDPSDAIFKGSGSGSGSNSRSDKGMWFRQIVEAGDGRDALDKSLLGEEMEEDEMLMAVRIVAVCLSDMSIALLVINLF